jgi:hypothetical protein
MQKEVKVDEETEVFLCGPVMLKVDDGPGHIMADKEIISNMPKQEEYHKEGLLDHDIGTS